jgi:hypothetical protein
MRASFFAPTLQDLCSMRWEQKRMYIDRSSAVPVTSVTILSPTVTSLEHQVQVSCNEFWKFCPTIRALLRGHRCTSCHCKERLILPYRYKDTLSLRGPMYLNANPTQENRNITWSWQKVQEFEIWNIQLTWLATVCCRGALAARCPDMGTRHAWVTSCNPEDDNGLRRLFKSERYALHPKHMPAAISFQTFTTRSSCINWRICTLYPILSGRLNQKYETGEISSMSGGLKK